MIKARFVLTILLLISYQTTFATPTIEQWETHNGARVYFVPAPDLPMIDVEVIFDAGSARDGDKPGIASLTNALVNQGTAQWSADVIAETFDNLGAQYGNSVDRDMATVSLRSLNDPILLEKVLNTFAVLLATPDFNQTAFEQKRQQTLASLQYQEQSPSDIADKHFYQAVFGNHPYALPVEGTPTSVSALTPEDVKAFHQRYYVAKNATVAIVGALDRVMAESVAAIVVNTLPQGENALTLPAVTDLTQAATINIDYPATQTTILIGQPGMSRLDPDYFSLYVGNYILGGSGLVSRLADEIREKRGLAYSTYSYFFPLAMQGPFVAGLQTRNDQANEAIDLLRAVLQKFVAEGVTEKELQTAKQGITGGFPLKIKSNNDILAYLAVIGFYHLPLDYLNSFNDKINAVTIDMIQDAFKRRLHLDKLVTVTVGGQN